MLDLKFQTSEDFIDSIRKIISSEFSSILKYGTYDFSLQVNEVWYNITYTTEFGTPFANGKSLTVRYGINNELINTSKKQPSIFKQGKKLESHDHKLFSKQFENKKIESLFIKLDDLFVNHTIDKEQIEREIFSHLLEFGFNFNKVEKFSENAFLLEYNEIVYFLNKVETYKNNEYSVELLISKTNQYNSEVIFRTQNKNEISKMIEFLNFTVYFFNSSKNNFVVQKRNFEKILSI